MSEAARFPRLAIALGALALTVGCHGIIIAPLGGENPGGSSPGISPDVPVTLESCGDAPIPGPSAAIRLTEAQFRNSVAALFPFPVDAGSRYPADAYNKQDFSTSLAANEVLFDDVQGFAETAEAIALQAVGHMGQILPCNPASNEAACARQFIDAFAPRAYRRPLEPGERDALVSLYDGTRVGANPLTFNLGVAAVIAAVLQSPGFLYKMETGTPVGGLRRLTGYELASHLSYLYWDGPPDDLLMNEASAGVLADGPALEQEAARLLQDPRARTALWHFFSEWLGFGDQIFDSRVDGQLAGDFAEEARRFVTTVVFEQPGLFSALLDNDSTFLDGRLARHYGVPFTGGDDEWQLVQMPPELRGGVLAKAQIATTQSAVGATSVVQRGKWIVERMLCKDLAAPPPGAQSLNPTLPDSATPRDRVEARAKIAGCAACHSQMDYTGLGMEDLDAVGRPRTEYDNGRDVDPSGILRAPEGDQMFRGTAELAQLLAHNPTASSCLVRQWYRYATGRRETGAEQCNVLRLAKRFSDGGFNLRDLLLSVSGNDGFALRKVGP
jgi:hypothetical protein